MSSRKPAPSRGQAVVELCLGLLVFVTVLVFGIYVGEMGFLMAKVHEAGAHAMWDSTAYQTYVFNPAPGSGSGAAAASAAQAEANAAYQDYDGLTGTAGAAPKLVFAQATSMTVQCAPDATVSYPWTLPTPTLVPPGSTYMSMTDTGGISCTATGKVQPVNMPTSFLENSAGGYFHSQNYMGPALTTVCSNGFPSGAGGCVNNKMNILLGDYGLNNGNGWNDAAECALSGTGGNAGGNCAGSISGSNSSFYGMTLQDWNNSYGYTGAPETWTNSRAPGAPGHVTDFYMSFRGSEDNFDEFNTSDFKVWETSPYHRSAYPAGANQYYNSYQARLACAAGTYCFLGKFKCN